MPAALPEARRAKVMSLLDEGMGPSDVARRLCLSRHTVARYRAAAQEQQRPVPQPRPMGGYRRSKVQRSQIMQLSALAVENPKRTLAEIREAAEAKGLPRVSLSTVARSLHKSGLCKRRARLVDPKTNTHAVIAAEREAFKHAQAHDPHLHPSKLLFFDETFFRLNEQAHSAWGAADEAAPILFKPKGRTMTTGLFLTLGVSAAGQFILHYEIKPPERPFSRLSAVFEASELKEPGRGVELGLTDAQILSASQAALRAVLSRRGVKATDLSTKTQLAERVLQLAHHGPLDLPRAGRVDVGGPKQPFRATVRDVARYWEQKFVPWFEEQKLNDLNQRTLVWDNASTHSAVQAHDPTRVSMFHRLFREWGFCGVIFLPPRSPAFNPAELCFAFLKHWVRKWAPDEGYTQEALEQAIVDAIGRVTSTMARNWIRGCGYGAQDRVNARRSIHKLEIWADVHGTVRAAAAVAAAAGLEDIRPRSRAQAAAPIASAAPAVLARRWSGIGPRPAGLIETHPKSYADALVDHDTTYEPERIVGERWRGRAVEYLIRWRGYNASGDTWEPLENLLVGRRQLIRDWNKRNKST